MIAGELKIRPRYGEVDKMGYVYHANYVGYCHQARTELLRSYGINDKVLEDNNIMLPVIEMNLRYLKPSGYDEEIVVKTIVKELPVFRFRFEFEIENEKGEKICQAESTVVFVDSTSRKPKRIPYLVLNAIRDEFKALN